MKGGEFVEKDTMVVCAGSLRRGAEVVELVGVGPVEGARWDVKHDAPLMFTAEGARALALALLSAADDVERGERRPKS